MLARRRKSISGIRTALIYGRHHHCRAAAVQHLQIDATFPRRDLMHSVT